MNSGTITGAITMKTIVITREADQQQARERGRQLVGLFFLLLLEQLAEHRHERAAERRVGHERAHQVRDLERERERRRRARCVPKYAAATTSRNRPTTRESPVATEKISVLTAVRRAGAGGWEAKPARYSTRLLRPFRGLLTMANIKSQIKRNNRSQRERIENRRYTSAIKTYFRRLETAVTEGNDEQITVEFRQLVSLIDKAVKRGSLHANTGARKKSRAERIRSGASVAS